MPVRRYHSGMDPTVAGALIGGGAGLIGFGCLSLPRSLCSERAVAGHWLAERRGVGVLPMELVARRPPGAERKGREVVGQLPA